MGNILDCVKDLPPLIQGDCPVACCGSVIVVDEQDGEAAESPVHTVTSSLYTCTEIAQTGSSGRVEHKPESDEKVVGKAG